MALSEALAYCRRATRAHAKTFYFCSRFLPRDKRQAIHVLYALCRHIDDIVDRAGGRPAAETAAALERVVDAVRQPRRGSDHPIFVAWRAVAGRYRIDVALIEELVAGVAMDLSKSRYATFSELDLYCYRVASVVGLMTSEIFGYSDRRALEHAAALGRAMQLTNICRDVGEDARMGRVYLPADELERFGVSEASLLSGEPTPPFVELMRFQIARARSYYRAAEPGIAMLSPECRYPIRLSSRIYGAILDRIERNGYDVLTRRAFVPMYSKVASLPAVWLETRRLAHGA